MKATVRALLVLGTCWGFFAVNRADEGRSKEASNLSDLAKKKLELAQQYYKMLLDFEKRQVGLPSSNTYYTWSRRWLEAKLDLCQTRKERLAAYEAHLDRMNAVSQKLKENKNESLAMEYYRVEAEMWVVKAKAKAEQ